MEKFNEEMKKSGPNSESFKKSMKELNANMGKLKENMKVLKEFINDTKDELVKDNLLKPGDDLDDFVLSKDEIYRVQRHPFHSPRSRDPALRPPGSGGKPGFPAAPREDLGAGVRGKYFERPSEATAAMPLDAE